MGKPSIDEEIERGGRQAASQHNGDHEDEPPSHKIYALHQVARTEREKLAEMSDIPPDLFRVLSVLRIHVDDVVSICKDILEAQKIWQRNWRYWNLPRKTDIAKLEKLCNLPLDANNPNANRVIVGEKTNIPITEDVTTTETLIAKIHSGYKFKEATLTRKHKGVDIYLTIKKDVTKVMAKCRRRWVLAHATVVNPHGTEKVYRDAKDELVRLQALIEEDKVVTAKVARWQAFIDKLINGSTRLSADNFEYYYLQRRRSKEGRLMERFMDAGQDQIAAEGATSPEDLLGRAAEDES